MNRTLKVFFACAFGAGIGAMIALQLGVYLWWLGPIIGGLVGYLSYEFKAVIPAIVFAWKKVVGFKPNWEEIKNAFKIAFWVAIIFAGIFTSAQLFESFTYHKSQVCVVISLILYTILLTMPGFLIMETLTKTVTPWTPLSPKWLKITLLSMSPIPFFTFWPIVLLYYLVKSAIWFTRKTVMIMPKVVKGIIAVSKITANFFKTVFLQIHSEIRLLCLVDAALGAGIGYLTGQAIIGAVAGGILGVLNYEIVSKRWLKLAPIKSQ